MRLGSVELKLQRNVQYTGRKAFIGKICFDEHGRMCVAVGYCPDCNGKVVMSLTDARHFADLYGNQADTSTTKILQALYKKRTF